MCTDTVRFLALFSFKTTLFSCVFVDEWPFFVDGKMEAFFMGEEVACRSGCDGKSENVVIFVGLKVEWDVHFR